jgi:hypothetical protein
LTQRGELKPRRGFTLIAGKEKLRVGKHIQEDEGELNLKNRDGID